MSANLPLTRRIARAALLIAAGAAPVIGAAGSASAAELPQTDLGSVSSLDGAAVGNTLDSGAQQATKTVGDAGGKAVQQGVPAAGKAVGKAAKTATPVVQKTAGDTAGGAGTLLGQTAKTATAGTGAAKAPAGGTLGGLPVQGLPIG
ncbi:ATP-binding protein [Streptomyces sp. NPDC012623]|uniref:ATP-binding protein n=1 Tax=unclassified Streptomyces TaxID=2593676 RepID=UPI00369222D5